MMRRLRLARINWHTTDTWNGMPVHRAFDVMAPIDVHSARCLSHPDRTRGQFSPKSWPQLFGHAENAEILIFQRGLASAVKTVRDASIRNTSETSPVETGKIRGICSPVVLGIARARGR